MMRGSNISQFISPFGTSAITVAYAGQRPVRVTAYVASGIVGALLSYDASALNSGIPNAVTYPVNTSAPSTFVLQPGQRLYTASRTVNIGLSIADSEAPDIRRLPASIMTPSRLNSSFLPIGQSIPIAMAGALPQRVSVVATNNLGIISQTGISTNDQGVFADAFDTLGTLATFVIAPGQTLYAISAGGNVFVSAAVSDILSPIRRAPRFASSRQLQPVPGKRTAIARAFEDPLRVFINNVSALPLPLSHEDGTFPATIVSAGGNEVVAAAPDTGPGIFSLPAGRQLEVYLAPGQGLYGGATATNYHAYTSAVEGDPLGYDVCECVCPC